MVAQLPTPNQIEYPDSDGKPMSDNTKQFRWITIVKYNLDWLFTNDENVFIAGDLLWYPVEGNPKRRAAPDVMVAFGRPKGDRGSYKQWQENDIAPQVVFEILSPGNTANEMASKLAFYDRHDVEEYYIYDPDTNALSGWERADGYLVEIPVMQDWISPRLGIKFDLSTPPELQIYRPDGEPFLSFEDVSQRLESATIELESTTRELENVSQTLATTEQALAAESDRNQRLAAKLRELGIEPDTI
ncbi:Uma2 family endonuclease [Chamaesiphon sp. VAR_48_metabat_403]|uniref:Uma2 family endonuclease n=1 Tax=Chamaesiphon sp. VAR_48_metabat_403 TaxID=2964700 RepID=UPI00286E919A|nr:Uma2 family endonuclease [Chamaesiphon sp. VAR_48_metabat_403]